MVAQSGGLKSTAQTFLMMTDSTRDLTLLSLHAGGHGNARLGDAVVVGEPAGVGCSIWGVSHGSHGQAGCALATHAEPGQWRH